MLNLQKTYVLLTLALGVLVGCSNAPVTGTSITVFANDATYQNRPELEAPWYGTLQAAQRDTQGSGLYYTVEYGQETQAIYTKDIIPQLESFIGTEVVVRGKLFASDTTLSALWPARVTRNEAKLIECLLEGEPTEPEEKFSPAVKRLLEEHSVGDRAEIIISFCDDIEITPESTREEIERLRAPLYAMLEEELEPYGVEITQTFWLGPTTIVEMPVSSIQELAQRPDTAYFSGEGDDNFPPP